MSDLDQETLNALKQALEISPDNVPLWLHYASVLEKSGQLEQAISALRMALELADDVRGVNRRLIPLLRMTGQLPEALVRVEKQLKEGDDAELRREYARILLARGSREGALQQYQVALQAEPDVKDPDLDRLMMAEPTPPINDGGVRPPQESAPLGLDNWSSPETSDENREPQKAEINPQPVDASEQVAALDWGALYITFDDVAGLEEVKNQIRLRIIAPFKNPEIYRAFRRTGGGGILLYGPPGCGKTYIARATAGECGARFMSVGIHDILDKFWGESERMLHALFEEARHRSPTVLFFDEFDALGSSRGRSESQLWKTLVDQLLQEMDGIGGRNDDVLIFAATNVPWNVDPAFRRPGRFDRILFVPPPDEAARVAILQSHASKLPGSEALQLDKLARQTPLMTGADLKSLCERASERALSRSLETGKIHPVTMQDFERELKQMNTSASEWLSMARNYAKYSNEGGQYDELTDFLKKSKRW